MSVHTKKSTWLIVTLMCLSLHGVTSEETQMEQTVPMNITMENEPKTNTTKDLFASETADPKKVEIVKQIRRLNEDGSYTVGYEAGDGTFKIESRDVQGNIKGTFGYVDQDGEIKRVSYSTSNSSQPPLILSVNPTVRPNRTSASTTRRPQPTLVYPKSSSSPTKPTVIQSIPRRRPVNTQSNGDDTTDVYGGSIALGTPRPLFTTTTGRPRLLAIHSVLASRQKQNEKQAVVNSAPVQEDQQETTLEATTNKVDDENFVTTNPVPVIRYPVPTEQFDQRIIDRPYIKQYPSVVPVAQFKTREFLRDNPGAPIPIGNQRVLFRYNPNIQNNENTQFAEPHVQAITPPNIVHVVNRPPIQNSIENQVDPNIENKPNAIALPIYQRNPQVDRYQMYNPYINRPERNMGFQRTIPPVNPMTMGDLPSITAPVSTRDLKLLLQQLLIRQNRLQALIDIREGFNTPGPPYQAPAYIPQNQQFEGDFRQKPMFAPRQPYSQQFSDTRQYNTYLPQGPYNPYQPAYQNQQNPYQNRNDYRSQDDSYRNEINNNYDPAVPYESQRFVPRRRFFNARSYDPMYDDGNSENENESQVEYLPPEVREALLLKMLMLAIHPDFSTMPVEPQMSATTQLPEYRKKVRNVQIIGEEMNTKDMETKSEKHLM